MIIIMKRQTSRYYIPPNGSIQYHLGNTLTKKIEAESYQDSVPYYQCTGNVKVTQLSTGPFGMHVLGSLLESSCYAVRSSDHMEKLHVFTLVDSSSCAPS